jgi:hypothetical protein
MFPEELAFMIVAIVFITTVGGIFQKKYDNKNKVGNADLAKIHADLEELKKSVAEMKEYITDMYIQQHDQRLK